MASDSESEDEDKQNPQNVRFNEREITELLACLGKMINIILPFFKKNTKYRKERKITKSTKKAKGKDDVSNEIRKLCSTIKAVVSSEVSAARSLEVVHGTAKIHTPAAVGTSRSHTEAIPGPSMTRTEAIPGTRSRIESTEGAFRSYTETISVTSKYQTESTAATSKGITGAAAKIVPEASTNPTDAIPGTSKSHTEPAVTKKSNTQTTAALASPRKVTDAVAGSCSSHTGAGPGATGSNTEAIPETSRNYTEPPAIKKKNSQTPAVLAISRSDTDAVAGTSRSHKGSVTVTKKSNSQTTATLATPRSDTDAVAESSRSHTVAYPGATRSNTEAIPETFRNYTEPPVIKKKNSQTLAVLATSRSNTDAVAGTSRRHTCSVTVTKKSNSQTTATLATHRSDTDAVAESSRSHIEPEATKKKNSRITAVGTIPKSDTDAVAGPSRSDTGLVPGTSTSHTETRVTETLHRIRSTTKEVPGTTINHTVLTVTKTSTHNHTKEVPGTTICQTEGRVTETLHRNQTKEVPGTTISHTVPSVTKTSNRNQTKIVTGCSTKPREVGVTETLKNPTKSDSGTLSSHIVAPVTETSNRNPTKEAPGTTISYTVPTVTKTSNGSHTIEDPGSTISLTEAAVTETSKNETKGVQFINSKQKNFTNSVSNTPKGHTKLEATAALKNQTKLQNPETSQTLTPTNSSVLSKPVVAELPRGQTVTVSQTPRNGTERVKPIISSTPTESMGTEKRRTQSVPGISHTGPVVTPRHSFITHTEAAAGSSKNNTVAVAATSRSRTEATAGNSRRHTDRNHTESIPRTPPRTHTGPTSETSRTHKERIAENSRTAEASFTKSHTINKNSEVSVRRIEAEESPRNLSGHTEPSLAGTAKGHTKSIVRRHSSIHIEPVPGTSRNNPKAGSSSRNAPGTVVPETTRNLITDMLGDPKSNLERKKSGIARSPAATGVSEIIRNHMETVVPGTSKKPTEIKLSHNSKNQKNVAVSGTLKGDETNLKRNHASSNHDDPKRPRLDNKCSCEKSIFNDEQHCKHNKIKHNKENYAHKNADFNKRQDHMKTLEAKNCRVAKDTKSADANKITATKSESTSNGYIAQASFNSPRTKTTESEIAQKQPNTKKIIISRSESTPNEHIEQAISTLPRTKTTDSEIAKNQTHARKRTSSRSESTSDEHTEQATSNSALTKITYCEIAQKQANAKKGTTVEQANLTIAKNVNPERKVKSKTEEFTPTKISEAEKAKKTWDDKRKRPTNETDIPETTPKRQMEQPVKKYKLAKKPRTDKDIKSVEANERKTTGKDTGPNADIGRATPNSTLVKIARNNKEKKTPDAKKKMATKSDSALNESTEKMDSTTADYGHEAKFYPSIDLTSDNDDDERKPPTTAVKVTNSKSVKDDKKIKNESIIDISEDTCFSDVTEENNEIPNSIKEPSPKPADHAQVLVDEPVIDIDEDTCFYDPAEEKASVTIKKTGPKFKYDEQILQEEAVVDLTDDLDDVSEQKLSVTVKESSSNTAGDDTDDVLLNQLESYKTINKHRTQLLEELETKRAEDLLADNVKRENANQNKLDSDTVVVSNFFQPSSSNQNTNQGIIITEKTPAQIALMQDNSEKRNDILAHESKQPYEKPKNNANQRNPNVVIPYVTISTKAPDVPVSTSTTAVQSTQKANRNNSAETRNSNAPVITPDLSISVRPAPIPQGSPNRSITSSAHPALLQQSIPQTPTPNVSITTSTAASEYRTPAIDSRPEKPNLVTKASKRLSSDLAPSPRATKPREQITNPIGINAQSSPPVSSEWVPSITLVSQSRHSSGNTGSSTDHSNDVTCEPVTPKPGSTSQETPSPHVGSTATVDLNSNRGENDSGPVQTPQTHWRRLVPLEIPTSNQGTSRWQNSNLRSEALSNRNPTQLNDSKPPRPTWHTPVPAENERPDLAQVTGVHRSPNLTTDQPNIPPHSSLNPVQPADQRIPTVQAFAPSNPPLRPVLLIPRHQSTMIDYQRAPMATRPTWHIPTDF